MRVRLRSVMYRVVAGVLLASSVVASAHAQRSGTENYPSRALRLIVPNVPGGATDFIARLVQPHWAEQLAQSVVVDNRGGAAGNIALETTSRAAPDGYTLMIGSNTQAINPSIYPKFPYTPLQHLIAVTQVADVPGSLVVHPSLPVKNVSELIAYLKANPGKLNFGSPSPSSANRLAMEIFMRHTGTRMQHVPYKGGSGQMLVALVANEVNLAFATFSSTVNFAKADRLRMLGVIAPERLSAMPDVPTMPELGFKDMRTGTWIGVFAPRGTPGSIVKRIFAVATKTMEHPDVLKRLAVAGTRPVVSRSPEEFRAFVQSETDTYATVIKEAGITAD